MRTGRSIVFNLQTNNIWSADLADMQLWSKFNKGISFLLWVIDIYGKYSWFIFSKEKKCIILANAFPKIRWIKMQSKQNMGG